MSWELLLYVGFESVVSVSFHVGYKHLRTSLRLVARDWAETMLSSYWNVVKGPEDTQVIDLCFLDDWLLCTPHHSTKKDNFARQYQDIGWCWLLLSISVSARKTVLRQTLSCRWRSFQQPAKHWLFLCDLMLGTCGRKHKTTDLCKIAGLLLASTILVAVQSQFLFALLEKSRVEKSWVLKMVNCKLMVIGYHYIND